MIDRFLQVISRMRRHQRVAVPAGAVKVNVGAGIEVAPGWINVDGSLHALASRWPRPVLPQLYRRAGSVRRNMGEAEYVRRLTQHTFVFHDLRHGLPFETGTVDFIFCSHVLEHFAREDAARIVREMHRVLKPGSYARIAVPDLRHAFDLYQEGRRAEALEYFFPDNGGNAFSMHRYMYDFELMRDMLVKEGFVQVEQRGYREGKVPDLELLDNRPEQSLFVEAAKA